jgi:endo-1,4-beta-D-glucanase Y
MPSHRSREQLDDDVRAAYWRWKARYLERAGSTAGGDPRYRIKLGVATDQATVSEGQGYGMIIMALMSGEDEDAQAVFDGLWAYVRNHPSENDPRLMDWHIPAQETPEPGEDGSAFDGDCDIAYALLLAEKQWGSSGRVDYRARAAQTITAILESTIGPDSHLPLLGDWVDVDGTTYNQYTTRTSDFMPDHFRAFALFTGDHAWHSVIAATQAVVDQLQAGIAAGTGLMPDFVVPRSASDHSPQPAQPYFLESPFDGAYYYNAGRVPWRIGVHALLNHDQKSRDQVLMIARWIRVTTEGEPGRIDAGYHLDGTPIYSYFSSFFAAPMGVAAMLDGDGQSWLNAVYDAVREREEGYYEDTVTLLALLVMTHNYWSPAPPPSPWRRAGRRLVSSVP